MYLLILLVCFHITDAYKTVEQFREQYKEVGKDSFSPSDTLVGRAMDFVYSNQTFMNLIARELWNVGSRAIDKIVEIKACSRQWDEETKREVRPSKWLTNSMMDVWFGNRSMIEVVAKELNGFVDKIVMRETKSRKHELNNN